MKHLRLIKWIMTALATLAGFMLLVFLLLAATVYVSYSNGSLQRWISTQLHLTINFKVAGVTWIGLHPTIEFKNVLVMARDRPLPTVRVDEGLLELDLWRSLWNLRPVSNSLILQGLHARFVETPDGQYLLQGTNPARESTDSKSTVDWKVIWTWLRPQQNIQLQDAFISIHRSDNSAFNFTRININWQKLGDDNYQMVLSFGLPQAKGNLRVVTDFNGDLSESTAFTAQIHGELLGNDLEALLDEVAWQNLSVDSGKGSIEWWGTWRQGQLAQLQVRTDLTDLIVHNNTTQAQFSEQNVAQDLLWQIQPSGAWRLVSQPWKTTSDENYYVLSSSPEQDGQQISLQFARLNLPMLNHIFQMLPQIPHNLQAALLHMDPHGSLHNGYLNIVVNNGQLQDYLADFKVDNLSIKAWQDIPAVYGLDASLHVTPKWGQVLLSAQHFSIDARPLLAGDWPPAAINADIRWLRVNEKWQVQLANLQMLNAWADLTASGSYEAPVDHVTEGNLKLVAGVNSHHLEQVLYAYLPPQHMTEKLYWWLTHAIVSAPVALGTLVINGPLSHWPFKDSSGHFELLIDTKDSTILPWRNWPDISGVNARILFSNHRFKATADTGNMLGAQIKQASVAVNDISHNVPADLTIKGSVAASGAQASAYVLQSPLKDDLGTLVHYLLVQGPLGLQLILRYPLAQPDKTDSVEGMLSFVDNRVNLADSPVAVEHMQGIVRFNQDIVKSDNLSARLLGEPFNINIFTSEKAPSLPKKVIQISTVLNANELAKRWPTPWSKSFAGLVPINFMFTSEGGIESYAVRANLTALDVELPQPLIKAKGQPLTLSIDASASDGNIPMQVNLGKVFNAKLLLQNQNDQLQFVQGVIDLGEPSGYAMPNSGLLVLGDIPYLSLAEWVNYLRKASGGPEMQSTAMKNTTAALQDNWWQWLPATQLSIAKLDIYDQIFTNLKLSLRKQNNDLQLLLSSPEIAGTVLLPINDTALRANLAYWHWTSKGGTSSPQAISAQALANVPPLTVSVQQFFANNTLIGKVNLMTHPTSTGMEIDSLAVSNDNLTAHLSGNISNENQSDRVNLSANINAKNFGAGLSQIGYTHFMSAGQGTLNADLSWRGSLFEPDMTSLVGEINVDLKKGSLSEVNPGISRLIGLLNINSWLRRIELNFSDVTDRGLAFDTLKGHFYVVNGAATTDDAALAGPALVLNMTGNMNLADQTLNETVVVIPQVGGGLALAAGLIGGPVVGIATWLADSVLSNTVLKGKGIQYHVTGTFSKPQFNAVQ